MIVCFIICFFAQLYPSSCCSQSSEVVHEGNNGETSALSWLGVLRVNLVERNSLKIALTGIVMVKEGYAIANADDVARIPKNYLVDKCKAMFIYSSDTPWYCTVSDYMVHPEYQYATTTTLALLELQSESLHFPLRPICWPPYTETITTDLYAFGFTDENQLLEKSVYKLQHVDLDICKDFYDRAGFTEGLMAPTSFRCGFATNNTRNCIWDNGMVLASNTTGKWKLLGFSIKGPGCSAPARFLDMLTYFRWIDTSTDQYNIDDEYRRSAFDLGFKKNETALIRDVPVHDLFATSRVESRRTWTSNDRYPVNGDQHQSRFYSVDKIDEDNVVIWAEDVKVPYTHRNCSENNKLVYSESTEIKSDGTSGRAVYKVSVMDLNELEFTCIDIQVMPGTVEGMATISYELSTDYGAGGATSDSLTPQGLLKHYIPRPTTTGKPKPGDWRPGNHQQVKYTQDDGSYVIKEPNVNILLKFEYKDRATCKVSVFRSLSEAKTTSTSTKKPVQRSYTVFNDTFNNLEKYLGVDVIEVDRYMKETASSASTSVKRMKDVGILFANYLVVFIVLSFT